MPQLQQSKPTVFVSHRRADTQLAEILATDLRQAGYQVWLDVWKIDIGDSIVEKINSGLSEAKYVILCYSEQGVLSPWMSQEWMSTLARQLEGQDVKLLPARLSGGKPPAILSDRRYADLVANWSKGVSDLIMAMNR